MQALRYRFGVKVPSVEFTVESLNGIVVGEHFHYRLYLIPTYTQESHSHGFWVMQDSFISKLDRVRTVLCGNYGQRAYRFVGLWGIAGFFVRLQRLLKVCGASQALRRVYWECGDGFL